MMRRMFAILAAVLLASLANQSPASGADSILLAFSSAQCPPCDAMKPTLAELEQSGIPVRHVDVHAEPHLVTRFGIRQTPTFVVISSGTEVTRLVGVQPAQSLRAALAIDPSGPLIPTRSLERPSAPQTRLTPIQSNGSSAQSTGSSAPARFVSASRTQPASEAMPSLSLADAVERAHAATVRLRVYDGQGYGAGTGTIIDTHGEEALVLTCGHLFRETQGKGKIEVDLFIGGQTRTVSGQVIDYDADARDIALVSIRPGFAVQPVQVIGSDRQVENGQPAFSFGCDRGADPSRRDTRITGINKYNQHLGVSNLEIAGAPIDGRSGGGLFDAQGRLIGVCNSADYKGDVGIYAGPGNVRWQLERIGMLELLDRESRPQLPTPTDLAGQPQPLAAPPERLASLNPSTAQAAVQPSAVPSSGQREVIVIIRETPDASPRVMTLQNPSPELMQLIQSQSNGS